jgi:hypothetical protein
MSELPNRPDLDQLRRKARELLRAATDGEPHAVSRMRAVSERVTLATAQLAVAREYGYRSWPALKVDVERRRSSASPASGPEAVPAMPGSGAPSTVDALEERWSFGGARPIRTSAGVLAGEALIVAVDHAVMYASLTPAEGGLPGVPRPRRLPAPGRPFARWPRRRRARVVSGTMRALADCAGGVHVVDSRGRAYELRPEEISGRHGPAGEPRGPMSVRLRLEPVPGRDIGWLEVRSEDGTTTRFLPSPRSQVRLGQLTPTPMGPAERALSDQVHWLIQLRLTITPAVADDILGGHCAAALAKMAEIQRSGELDRGSQLADQLENLCAVLTEHRPTASLPPSWSRMLDAAGATDGPSRHLDIGTTLPAIEGITVLIDSLFSEPESWRLYLRAVPGWWEYSQDGQRKWSPVSVCAKDDLGNSYLSTFGGSTGARRYEELGLGFHPRLDPLARSLMLTFRGAREQLAVDLRLDDAVAS